jgi:hypothetical protein
MNPLTAQHVSRFEHSQHYQNITKREVSRFQTPSFKPFRFISKLFNPKPGIKAPARTA